jgi:microcystin-dependent protein
MSEPFLAEIKIVAFNFAPRGWAFCDGQILPINQNQSLFSLLGTTYGGDGRTSFALPGLRGRVPIHKSSGHGLGQKSGAETVGLNESQNQPHTHPMNATTANADNDRPGNRLPATTSLSTYRASGTSVNLDAAAITSSGGQGHDNVQPFLALNYCIALQGLFPSRN